MTQRLDELLALYDDDALDPSTLNWREFQDAVFIRMFRKCRLSGELRNEHKGEVDFILIQPRLHPISGTPVGEDQHLFECKHYDRTIELAVAAKLLLVGLRRPNVASINLVSETDLQPQAADYARFFYQQDDEDSTDRKLGGATVFRHFITHDLIDFTSTRDCMIPKKEWATPPGATQAGMTWSLIELRPYSEREVSLTPSGAASLSTNRYYRVEATVTPAHTLKEPSVHLDDPSGSLEIIEETTVASDLPAGLLRFSVLFRAVRVPNSGRIALRMTVSSGRSIVIIRPLATLAIVEEIITALDFRPQETLRFQNLFGSGESWRLILLTGEAGTGKSFLCNVFADDVRAKSGSDVVRFDVAESADEMMRQIMLTLMLPPRLRADPTFDELQRMAVDVVDRLAPREASKVHDEEVLEPVDLIEAVAHMAVALGPRLIIIRNCERLGVVTANGLVRLVRAIERRGWGDVRIILEGRDDAAPDAWNTVQQSLRAIDDVNSFYLPPMTSDQVYGMLESVFDLIPVELKETCWRRAGGYPLFLQNFLAWLLGEGGITRQNDKLRILSPGVFSQEFGNYRAGKRDALLVGGRSDDILIARLAGISLARSDDMPYPLDDPHFALGLSALAETPERVVAMEQLLDIGHFVSRIVSELRPSGVLDESALPGELRFRHDLLRSAAIELAKSERYTEARNALLALLPQGSELADRSAVELLGDLQRFAGSPTRAWINYQRATKAATDSGAYLDVCRIASKQQALYERGGGGRAWPFIEYLQILVARAWAEWNCGSLSIARDTYRRIIDLAEAAADVTIDSTLMRSIVGRTRSRLVGIDVALSDATSFVDSAINALREYGDIGDYNSVMNRIVLFCGRFGLPQLGLSFVERATEHVVPREGEVERELEGEAVICADVARLFLQTMPHRALSILQEEEVRSHQPRQRLHAKIDVLMAQYACSGELCLARYDELRTEAMTLGLYGFLIRLDMIRAASEVEQGGVREAMRLLKQTRERVAVRQELSHIGLANNSLLCALAAGDVRSTREWTAHLIKVVGNALDEREVVIQPLQTKIRSLAAERSNRLSRRYEKSAFALPVSSPAPAFCGNVLTAWFNLRRLAIIGDAALSETLADIAGRRPSQLDAVAAEAAHAHLADVRGISFNDASLALCFE